MANLSVYIILHNVIGFNVSKNCFYINNKHSYYEYLPVYNVYYITINRVRRCSNVVAVKYNVSNLSRHYTPKLPRISIVTDNSIGS